jgi:hypothetical protein
MQDGKLIHACFLLTVFFGQEAGRKCSYEMLVVSVLHSVTFQMMALQYSWLISVKAENWTPFTTCRCALIPLISGS